MAKSQGGLRAAVRAAASSVEQREVAYALGITGGDEVEAAKRLGIDLRHFQRLVTKYDIGLNEIVREVRARTYRELLVAEIARSQSIAGAARAGGICRKQAQLILRAADHATVATVRTAHRRRPAKVKPARAPVLIPSPRRRLLDDIDARLAKLDAIAAWRAARPKPPRRPRLEAEAAMKAERAQIKAEAEEREELIRERERLMSAPTPISAPLPARHRWLTLAEREARAQESEAIRARIAEEQEQAARVHIRERAAARGSR